MHRVSIIGAGVVGTAMGYLLKERGYPIVGIASRTLESARRAKDFIGQGEASTDLGATAQKGELVFITTSDSVIEEVCKKVASEEGFKAGVIVFHMSGALASEVLRSARNYGAHVASFHPLQSLANVREAVENIPGSYFCMEGDEGALSVARQIVNSFGGREITIKVDKKPLYHAGASVASNFLVATVRYALELFETIGITREDSLNALMPLIKGTVKNIENLRIPSALTGPISRGDTEVIEDHLKAISKERPEMVKLYTELGRYTVKVALEKGTIKEHDAERMISLLDKYKEGIKK